MFLRKMISNMHVARIFRRPYIHFHIPAKLLQSQGYGLGLPPRMPHMEVVAAFSPHKMWQTGATVVYHYTAQDCLKGEKCVGIQATEAYFVFDGVDLEFGHIITENYTHDTLALTFFFCLHRPQVEILRIGGYSVLASSISWQCGKDLLAGIPYRAIFPTTINMTYLSFAKRAIFILPALCKLYHCMFLQILRTGSASRKLVKYRNGET